MEIIKQKKEQEQEQEQEHEQEQEEEQEEDYEQEQEEEQEEEQVHGIEKNNNEEKSDKRNGHYLEGNHDHDVEEVHDDDDDVNHTYVYDNEKYVHKVEDNHLTDNDMIEEDEENDQKRDEDLNEEEEYEHDSNHNNIDIDESNKEESEAEQNLKKEDYDNVDEDKKDNLQKNVAYANTIIKGGRNLRNLNKSSTSFDKTKKEQNNNMNGGGTNFIKTLSDENNLQNNVPHGRRKRKVSKDLNLNNEYVYGTNLNFKHARNVNDDIDEHEESENNHDQNNNEEINEHNQNDDNPIHNDNTNANNDDDDDNNIINNNENVVKTNEKILNGKQTNLRGSHLKLKTNRTKKNKKLSNKLNRNIAKNVNKNNNGRYGNVGRAQASTTQGNEKKVHGTNDNAEYTTHNRGRNSTTTNFTNRHSRVTFNNNNEGTYYAGHNNNTSTSHGNRHNDPHEEAEPKKGKKKRVTEEGSKESGKINVGDSYQVSNLPNFFLCRSELMYKNYDTQENTNDQMCLSCSGLPCHCKVGEATLVYSPIMLERVRERCLKNRGYHKCVKNEIELSAYVQECAKSWKSNIDEWVPFSPEYAYKLLHYANYDPHKAISIMKSSEFSFRKIMDPPTRKYQNKWKPKDKREHISKNPFPSPLTIRTYLSKRHHNSGYHLR
ncbi:hypothetical protein PFFVO_06168 [Plasmodium falciparum Vietnam Oak-Knoll (FVO)]|uniref:ELM2 domain-containing protein n=1 Tax=Plasmodium falciparum Vietnam Oak-Knoll (FVO) TaxID=1036723 RepID=A0A024UW92_PLAFA|nr:hypothetical protein PFFVO_06168 [Plasmodium falciparum Vietnam Oak-Knoll (FVO)]